MSKPTLLAICLTVVAGCGTRVDYLLPQGFVGPAMIIFDDPLGTDVERVGWRHEQYRFGDDGVLRLKTKAPERLETQKFYHVEKDGRRREIPQDRPDTVSIIDFSTSVAPRSFTPTRRADGSFVQTTQGGFGITIFIVGRRADYANPYEVFHKFQDAVMQAEHARLQRAGLE